jgi:hypothetical protein
VCLGAHFIRYVRKHIPDVRLQFLNVAALFAVVNRFDELPQEEIAWSRVRLARWLGHIRRSVAHPPAWQTVIQKVPHVDSPVRWGTILHENAVIDQHLLLNIRPKFVLQHFQITNSIHTLVEKVWAENATFSNISPNGGFRRMK